MKFSSKKFSSLSPERRLKKITEFSDYIERNWENIVLRKESLINFQEFLEFFSEESFRFAARAIHPEMNHREFLQIVVPLEQRIGSDRADKEIFIRRLDGCRANRKNLDIVVLLANLRSAFNVGSILRTAECFGIKRIVTCGYTPLNKRTAKTAMGSMEYLEINSVSRTEEAVNLLKKENRTIYALETATTAQNIYETKIHLPSALILGNEALGIPKDILCLADYILQIPLSGWKNSLNVAVAAAIAVSEAYRQNNMELSFLNK